MYVPWAELGLPNEIRYFGISVLPAVDYIYRYRIFGTSHFPYRYRYRTDLPNDFSVDLTQAVWLLLAPSFYAILRDQAGNPVQHRPPQLRGSREAVQHSGHHPPPHWRTQDRRFGRGRGATRENS